VLSLTEGTSLPPNTKQPIGKNRYKATIPATETKGFIRFEDGLVGKGQPVPNNITYKGSTVIPVKSESILTLAPEGPAGEDCPRCAAADAELALQERLRNREMTRLEDTSELRLDAVEELITGSIDLDAIEKTRVISDQSMLLIREPGESQRSFLLRSDGAFAVGRDPRTNTLTMRDPALSAHHFKVVPDNGYYYRVDLDSTNGTYVNRRRVRAAKLASGDIIQAGQVELEFRSFLGQVA